MILGEYAGSGAAGHVLEDEMAAALAACLLYLGEAEEKDAAAEISRWAHAGRMEAMGIDMRAHTFDRRRGTY